MQNRPLNGRNSKVCIPDVITPPSLMSIGYYYYYLFAIKHTIIKYTCKNYKNRQDNFKAFKMH